MSAQIWSDTYIQSLAVDAIGQIAIDVNCIYVRECVATQFGVSVIRLPNYVRTVRRVTWRGRTLDAMSFDELTLLTPATVFVDANSPNSNIESSIGRPLFYAMHPTNPWDIRLYPTPNESFTTSGEPNPYAPTFNSPSCIVDSYRMPDSTSTIPTISLPIYIVRRTQKAYVLWKAFASEGKGQNLRASAYYKSKYDFLIGQFRLINEGAFVGKRYSIDEASLTIEGYRWPKPMLPPQFERNYYR